MPCDILPTPCDGPATMALWLTPFLLILSNIVMTWAWYGHLRQPQWPMWWAIGISWGIAFFEYCLAVPANRIGYGAFTGQQLKVMQEVITLAVFAAFSVTILGEPLRWNTFAAMACLVLACIFIFFPVD
jgi:uncharacterized protein (DUF486 family)